MKQELNRPEGLVNVETTCMQNIKSMIRTMDQKVKTFASSTPQQDPLEDAIERSPEHAVTATTETATIEEREKEASLPSEEPLVGRGKEDSPGTDNRVPLMDDEYMAWLVENNTVAEEEVFDHGSYNSEKEEEEPSLFLQNNSPLF
ncbi:hypothetical protein Aduo_001932 [Ancylostoma duodenale]